MSDPTPTPPPASPPRLMSLDALRGFDMFWIVGGDALAHALARAYPRLEPVGRQFEHVAWAGFHLEDLIFPMFVFIVGVSLVFSLGRTIEREGRGPAVRRVVRRAALLFLLGIIYSGGFRGPFDEIRLLGVLQRIALAYLGAGLLFCFAGWRTQLAACVGLLAGYWALLAFVPVPGLGAGHFEPGANLANWIDARFLPLRKYDGAWDPEGLLSTLPAVAGCLLGVFAGRLLKGPAPAGRKVALLIGAGVAGAALGWLWHPHFPVVKKIWTSSFVLVTAGYSAIFLGVFYLVIDVWDLRAWARPFVWIGMNPITIYLVHELVDLEGLARRLIGGELGERLFGRYEPVAVAAAVVALTLLLCRFLYRRKIFLRL